MTATSPLVPAGDASIPHLVEPRRQVEAHLRQVPGPSHEQRGDALDAAGTAQDRFGGVTSAVDATGHGKGEPDPAVEQGERVERERELGRCGEVQVAVEVEGVGVDVGLVEAVEHRHPRRPGVFESSHEVGQRRVEGRQLDGDGDVDGGGSTPVDFTVFATFAPTPGLPSGNYAVALRVDTVGGVNIALARRNVRL